MKLQETFTFNVRVLLLCNQRNVHDRIYIYIYMNKKDRIESVRNDL